MELQIDIEGCLGVMRACAIAIFLEQHEKRKIKIAPTVRANILLSLANRHRRLDLEDAASALHMSEPTLRRKLKTEGTSFQRLTDEVRFSLAKELLLTGMFIAEVAANLDYSSCAALSRAFKDFTGECPLNWLAQQRN